MDSKFKTFLFIVSVFFVSLMVEIIPLPHWGEYLRPQLVLLALIYWQLTNSYKVNLVLILCLGLLLDYINHIVLGEHALALIVISYFLLKFHQRIKMFALGRQMLAIFGLLLGYHGILLIFTWLTHDQTIVIGFSDVKIQDYWLSFSNAIISAVIWPCFAAVLYNLQKYFKIL